MPRPNRGLVGLLILLGHTGLHTGSWDLAGPLGVWGVGMGLVVAPLFDSVLSSLTPNEVGSGSGVRNALQQLGSAVSVAVIGTVFLSTLSGRAGVHGESEFVAGLERCAQVGIVIAAAVGLLVFALPRRAREEVDAPEATEAVSPTHT